MDFDQRNGGRKPEEQLSTSGKKKNPLLSASQLIMFNAKLLLDRFMNIVYFTRREKKIIITFHPLFLFAAHSSTSTEWFPFELIDLDAWPVNDVKCPLLLEYFSFESLNWIITYLFL